MLPLISEEDFKEFLSCLCFQFNQLNLNELENHVQEHLLDYHLGINDRSVYYDLMKIIEKYAETKKGPITYKDLDTFFRNRGSKYLLAQKFEVNKDTYIERNDLKNRLEQTLQKADGQYIIVTGLPGIGKSTSLTAFFDEREALQKEHIVRYYCFVDINDSQQKQRLDAESFQINLLHRLRNEFWDILERRFNTDSDQLYNNLETIGSYLLEKGSKLIIFLDGLDHAERMEEDVVSSLIKSLPEKVPKGVVIVVGTQQLHKWPRFLKQSRDIPETYIEIQPFDLQQTASYLTEKKGLSNLTTTQVQEIHNLSEGLPLYLWYISEKLKGLDGDASDLLKNLLALPDGNIITYYEMLWDEFERMGKGNAKHLCGIMACLRFPLHEDELFDFQTQMNRPDFIDSYKLMQHLIKKQDCLIEIFHNSFREFVLHKFNSEHIAQINSEIFNHMKNQRGSNSWFTHIFEYAYLAGEYDYVLENVNREFVDFALSHYRANRDIENAIYWATESAIEKHDLIALGRIAALKLRTKERIDQHLDRHLLLEALLDLGKREDVIRYSFSSFYKSWLTDFSTTLYLLSKLPEYESKEFGAPLFKYFHDNFRGTEIKNITDLENFARCFGIYGDDIQIALEWCAKRKVNLNTSDEVEAYMPFYAPHVEGLIEECVRWHAPETWQKLKTIKVEFPKQLIQYYIIRALAQYGDVSLLRQELDEYISFYDPINNPELAFYATLAGFPRETVGRIQGLVTPPSPDSPDYISYNDTILNTFRLNIISLAYSEPEALDTFKNLYKARDSFWKSYFYYLCLVGRCIAKFISDKESNWYEEATEALDVLQKINKREGGERLFELLELCRAELSQSLYLLTKAVATKYPDKLNDWLINLNSLKESELWTLHYGINESVTSYSFELNIYDKLSDIPECRQYLLNNLNECSDKYKKTLNLKGEARCCHFLRLSIVASKCGFRNQAEEWLKYGIQSTLIYGYHKDVTLFQLIDIMEMLNHKKPEDAFKRSTEILEMIDWMPTLTDGKETRHLPAAIFSKIVKLSHNAATRLLREYSRIKARWQVQDCLVELFEQIDNGDPEILWLLTSYFVNTSSTPGEFSSQTIQAKSKVLKIIDHSENQELLTEFRQRLDHYIRTNISRRLWPKLNTKYWSLPKGFEKFIEDKQNETSPEIPDKLEYDLEGKKVPKKEIEALLKKSVPEYIETLKKLGESSLSLYGNPIILSAFDHLISNETSSLELCKLKDSLIKGDKWTNHEPLQMLGHRFIEIGDAGNALDCLEVAYYNTPGRSRWERQKNVFAVIEKHDKQRAISVAAEDAHYQISKYNGSDTPVSIAGALDILGQSESLETVFEDYLTHVKELFNYLPKKNEYEWLQTFSDKKEDFNNLVVDLMIDQLATPEMDNGNRLIDAFVQFSIKRPELALPIIFERFKVSEDLIRHRIFILIYILSHKNPLLMKPYIEDISVLIDAKSFQTRMGALKIFQRVFGEGNIENHIKLKIDSLQMNYSKVICYRTFRLLHLNPSNKFLDFLKYLPQSLKDQVEACREIIGCSVNDLWGKIEYALSKEGWNVETEVKKLEEEWYGFAHPQGFPRIPILTTISMRIFHILNEIINEVVEKSAFSIETVEAFWRILQPCDPERNFLNADYKPEDIPSLTVTSNDQWLQELEEKNNNIERLKVEGEWITLFEKRCLAQDDDYSVPYREYFIMYSSLVQKGLGISYNELHKGSFAISKIEKFCDKEFVTLSNAKEIISLRTRIVFRNESFAPIIAWCSNPINFKGYEDIVSLSGYYIDHYDLHFKGFDLFKEDNLMIKYEVWNEGYEDNSYSREKLSNGTRLQIKKPLLVQILNDCEMKLCRSFSVKRKCYERWNKGEAKEITSVKYYIISSTD